MTVIRKMNSEKKTETDNMIAKGGEILSEKKLQWVPITLNLMPKVVNRIDKQREPGVSRNLWIREAIKEKLNRDEQNGDLI